MKQSIPMADRPRIAVVTPVFPNSAEPFRGIFNYRRAKALQPFADIRVFCMMSRYPAWLRPAHRKYTHVEAGFTTPGMEVEYLHYPAIPMITRPLNSWSCARALLPRLREFKPDAVLGYWVFPEGLGAVMAARRLTTPVVLQAMGSDLRLIPEPVTRRLIQRALRQADFVLTVADELREHALRLGSDPLRTRTVRNGCDPEIFRLANRDEARRELGVAPDAELVVFVGRLAAVKGVGELLEATALLATGHPKLRVVCIGEGVLEDELKAKGSRSEVARHVEFVGRKQPTEIARWLAAANLLCLPSYSEGCPNVVLEALFCGRPVVASNVGGIPELVNENCAILTPPRDSKRLAEGIAEALRRPWNEREIAAHYGRSWDDVGRETFEVIQDLLRQRES